MKAIALLVAAVVALALAATASAKEIKQITACGASDCRTTTDPTLLQGDGGGPTGAPTAVSSYYTIEFTAEGDEGQTETWMVRYYPSQGLGRGGSGSEVSWFTVPPAQQAAFRELTEGIQPFRPDGSAPASAPNPSDEGFPWVVLLFSLGFAAVLGAAALFNVRRRTPAPAPGS